MVAHLLSAGELGPGVVDVVLDPVELGLVINDRGQPANDHPAQDEAEQRRDQAADRNALPVTPGLLAIFRPATARIRPRTANTTAAGDKIAVRAQNSAARPKTRANTAAALVLAGRAVVTSRPPPCGAPVTRWQTHRLVPSSVVLLSGVGSDQVGSAQRCGRL